MAEPKATTRTARTASASKSKAATGRGRSTAKRATTARGRTTKTATSKRTTGASANGRKAAATARGRSNGLTGAGTPGGKNLVIVESPTKARTLAGFLGRGYDVRASVGHVRDLPKSKLGVDVDHGFAPQYVVPKEKSEVVKQLKSAAKNADMIYLATDPDREGEAISWHLVEAVGLRNRPLRRVEFHEITRDAIREAFEHPRELDTRLIDAQQARRVLDRLVGYKISPLLWKKVRRGLSAGRVQSVALRMIVEREREIQNFQAREYWTIDADLLKERFPEQPFRARLLGFANDRKRELEIGDSGVQGRRGAAAHAEPPPVTAVHHQHPAAGGIAAAGLHRPPHDDRGTAALRGTRDRRRGSGRPHNLHADRLNHRLRTGD
jgi:hypothetical protein